jgi:hypothetical protein
MAVFGDDDRRVGDDNPAQAPVECRPKEKRIMVKRIVSIVLAVVAGVSIYVASSSRAADPPKERFFEMRTYTATEGKLDALNARFRDHTNKLFVKHGMELIGYWTPTDGEKAKNTLVYILAFPSREAREASWKAFQADPEWKAAREASEKDGKIVTKTESVFLKPTDYSPMK